LDPPAGLYGGFRHLKYTRESAIVKFGTFFFGTVDMPDAGMQGPPAHRRIYTQADYLRVYRDLTVYAQCAEQLGFDSMWTAEHHFQNHGFEVVPNVILLNAVLAERTNRIRLGSLVHVLTSWHPVRFAEDYSLADALSGGRLLCGLGRGTEPRESNPFGVNVGWGGDPDDVRNREVFEEQVAIFKAAISQEEFSFHGKHYDLPPAGLEFRDEPVTTLPLVPRPMTTPVRIYQAVRSEDTLQYAARERHIAVFWQTPRDRLDDIWHRYADLVFSYHGVRLRPGEDRMLVMNTHIGDTSEAAIQKARPGHDELRKLIWPNTIKVNPSLARRPMFSLEESIEQGSYLVGTAAQVRDELAMWCNTLGVEYLTIFPHFPGMTQADTIDQLNRFARHVMPALRGHANAEAVAG
jgi:alkanesulfonate monooxygenase SsuD/methylene tetrahydromethanopterin reductase-like flavin-dependent oxidoreductase (luciferase family)